MLEMPRAIQRNMHRIPVLDKTSARMPHLLVENASLLQSLEEAIAVKE
jgi:hypothetical protein